MSATQPWFAVFSGEGLAVAGVWVAVLLTLAIFSRLIGENVFSRLAQFLFVGVAAGFAVGMAWRHVLWPRLQLVVSDFAGHWPIAIFMVLGVLLLVRGIRPSSALGDAPVSILVGVGAGLALVGAVRGTLAPQISVAISGQGVGPQGLTWHAIASLVTGSLATVLTLAAFHHHRRESGLPGVIDRAVQALGVIGRRLLMLALGGVLAGAWLAFFTALQGRLGFVFEAVRRLVAAMGL